MKKPILTLIPSAYNTGIIYGKVYSILPVNGVGDFQFFRNCPASRVQENGLIENVNNNEPRLDWLNSDCPSLLLEPQRTNYAIYSNDASQWANISGSQSITKTQNYSIAPDGEQTATRLQATATGSGYSLIQLSTTGFTGNYSGSVYLKSNTGNTQNVIVYGRNTSVTSYPIGNEWQRIEIQGSGTSGQNLYLFLGSFPNNGSDESIDISVWGGQLEQGDYPTSLIYTESSAITRFNDRSIRGGNSNLFDITEGTFFVDVTPFKASDYFRISLSNETSNEEIIYLFLNNNSQVTITSKNSGVSQVSYTANITFGTRNKLALTFKNNEFKIYVNGSLEHTDTSGAIAENLYALHFAGNNGAFNFFQGKVHDTRVYDRVLTEAEAIELTTL